MPRSEFRAAQRTMKGLEATGVGNCRMNKHICDAGHAEVGCLDLSPEKSPDGQQRYRCICTHTMETPKVLANGTWTCDRNIVTTYTHPPPYNLTVLQPPQLPKDDVTQANMNSMWSSPTTATLVLLAICLLSVMSASLICFLKRKSLKKLLHRSHQTMYEVSLNNTGGRLLPDRFITNPTYESAILDLAIRVFSPDEIKIMSQIGQGCFGKVFKAELNGDPIAVKVVKNEHAGEAVEEVETMAAFNHHNILQMIGIAKSADMEVPWLIFEFMEYGDLASVLRSNANQSTQEPECGREKYPLKKDTLLDIAYQISEGMKYLCSQHFVHRDLAARNCLVGNYGVVKISDFGLSRDVYTCDYYKIGGSRLLPVRWMPPESVLYGRFTLESDVWAYGVLLWEIYTWGKQPYFGHSNEEVVQLILDGVLLCPPSDCPTLICQMMEGCWKTDPKDRLKFLTICDKFLKSCKDLGQDLPEESEYEVPNKPKPCCLEYVEVV